WVKTSWAKWKINTLVNNILQESGCKPHDVMARLNCTSADVHVVAIKLADTLFADNAFTDGSFLVAPIMAFVTTLLASTWSRYRKVLKRQATSIDKKTREPQMQKPTIASIRTYLKKLEALVTLLSMFKDQETVKNLSSRHEQVNTMLATAKKDPTKAELVVHEWASIQLTCVRWLKVLELLIETTLAVIVLFEGDKVVIDFGENIDIGDWKSGVEEYDKCSEDEPWEDLGMPEKKLPFFQMRSDPDAAIDPWSKYGQQWLDNPAGPAHLAPQWHQLVGILRLIDRVLDGRPVILMDGVGVGKTMQAVGLIAHYREHYRKHGKFPGKFAQQFCKKTGRNIPDLPTMIMSPPNLHYQ
ncbi:hypothetical protein BD769DRAFT_1372784, partial [Suillus cothurnatus]